MNKLYLLFFLMFSVLAVPGSAVAQNTVAPSSIIPGISEEYLDRLIAAAKANYPRVKANNARVNIALSNIGKAKVSWFDAFTFSYIYQPNKNTVINAQQPTYSYFNGIQTGLFFNLGNFLQKPYGVRQAKEELVVASRERDEYLINLELEVKTRYYTYVQRLASVKGFTQASVDASSSVQELKRRYQRGEDTFDNLNRANTAYYQQNDLKLVAEAALLTAKAQLEALVGDKLENIK